MTTNPTYDFRADLAAMRDAVASRSVPTLWIDEQSGIITCPKHAGSYLTAAIERHPRARDRT